MHLTLSLAALLFPFASATAAPVPVAIVPGVVLLRGAFEPGSQPDGNTVILEVEAGLIVVDTGRHAEHTQAILDHAKAAGRPIAAVVNTHWHLDHIAGNAAIRAAYPSVRIYASGALEGALAGFLAKSRRQLAALIETTEDPKQTRALEAEAARIDAGRKLAPDVVIDGAGERTVAGCALRIGLETDAVTAGDVWILDEERAVLIAGDLVTLPAPFLDTACPARWKESLDRIAALEFDLLLPGHGAPLTKAQFTTYRAAFGALLECARSDAAAEGCIDGWMTATGPLAEGDERFTRAMMAYYADLLRSGKLSCP